jgi:cytochrome c nitrite reductase small subunit
MLKLPLIIGIAALLIVTGVGVYVTDFTAYLGNNPSTCNNCHVMDAVYESWYHSGHKLWATCGDCHTPHALIPKYFVKAQSGYHHVTTFFFGEIPDAIRAKKASDKVVQENCVRCHEETVSTLYEGNAKYGKSPDRYCFDCHRSVSHGERGISLLPYQHKEKDK